MPAFCSATPLYTGYRVNKEVDKASPDPQKIANDAMKGVDTSDLKSLEK